MKICWYFLLIIVSTKAMENTKGCYNNNNNNNNNNNSNNNNIEIGKKTNPSFPT